MKTLFTFIFAFGILAANTSSASTCNELQSPESGNWTVLTETSKGHVAFQNSWKTTHEGRLEVNNGEIAFNEQAVPEKFAFSISVAQVVNNRTNRQFLVNSEQYFDTRNYPNIEFESQRIQFHPEQKLYYAFGTIIVKNQAMPIAIPFELVGFDEVNDQRQAIFEASFKLDRTDFGVGSENEKMGEFMTFSITLKAEQPQLPAMEVGTPDVK